MKKALLTVITLCLVMQFLSCTAYPDVNQIITAATDTSEPVDTDVPAAVEQETAVVAEQDTAAETDSSGLVVATLQTGAAQTDTEVVGGSSGESGNSDVYNNSFHSFSSDFIQFVGIDKFDEWINMDHEKTEDDPYFGQNIYEFIKYFNISEDDFSRIYYGTDTYYGSDYNVDLLYGGDEQAIYDYYKNGGDYEDTARRAFDLPIKIDLTYCVDSDLYSKWKEDNNYEHFVSWSIPEFVYYFGISEEKLKEIVAVPNNLAAAEAASAPTMTNEDGTVEPTVTVAYYDYNYDSIYRDNAEIKQMIADGIPGYQIDELI